LPHTILIVDDDRAIASALAGALRAEGHDVRTAYDGLSALQEAGSAPPDLVLSDIAMPGLDGVALAGRLRARGIPVALLSSAADPRIPGVPHLAKPFDLDQLMALVDRLMSEPASD
jgi:two-component system, OmpR family, response regulator MprA